jgi:hypothetical protein
MDRRRQERVRGVLLLLLSYGTLLTPGCSSFVLVSRQSRVVHIESGFCLFDRKDEVDDGPSTNEDDYDDNNRRKDEFNDTSNILSPSKKQQAIKRRQGEAASAAMDLPNQPVVKTLKGGSDLLFRMVRQQQQQQQQLPRWHPPPSSASSTGGTSSSSSSLSSNKNNPAQPQAQLPLAGVVVPIEARAAATTIWKNARKRNKPSLWRYAIRTFDRFPLSQTTNVHYEGCLVAAAKLGWSEKALSIYETVRERQEASSRQLRKSTIQLTDNMVLSLVKACVGDALRSNDRSILDTIVQILQQQQEDFEQPTTTAAHWNPVAAAYRKLSYHDTAREILAALPAPRYDGGARRFHVQHVHAKDKGSYAINVSTSVATGNFGRAVLDLKNMTELGLYPETRHLDEWAALSGQ